MVGVKGKSGRHSNACLCDKCKIRKEKAKTEAPKELIVTNDEQSVCEQIQPPA